MKKNAAMILCMVFCTLFLLSSCGDVEQMLDVGMDNYIHGQTEQPITAPPVDAMLADLLKKYGGGYRLPDIIQIDEPEPDTESDSSDADESGDHSSTQDFKFDDVLDSRDDLVETIRELCRNLDSSTHTFRQKNGFSVTDSEIEASCLDIALNLEPVWSQYVKSILYSYPLVGNVVTLKLNYHDTKANMRKYIEESFSIAKSVEKKLNLASLSDYEKCLAVNDYLCDTCYYPSNTDPTVYHTTYGALKNGVCVCDGYARTFWLLLTDVGMDIMFVTGDAGGPHAWNMAKVDGKWYQVDVCWNDGSSSKEYFLVDDNYMSLSRVWDRSQYPACSSGTYRK